MLLKIQRASKEKAFQTEKPAQFCPCSIYLFFDVEKIYSILRGCLFTIFLIMKVCLGLYTGTAKLPFLKNLDLVQ